MADFDYGLAKALINNGDGTYSVKTTLDGTEVTLDAGDLQIGAVEIKNATTDDRAVVDASGAVSANVTKIGSVAVTMGAGAVGTGTQRMTLASDDPAVAALQILDDAIAGTEMQVDVVAALPAGTNNIGDVDVLSLPALAAGTALIGKVGIDQTTPGTTNAVVEASAAAILAAVDGTEALLTTIDADTGALAGAVAGTEVQVDVVAALPAGTNNIGDVDVASIAAGDNNIGNVDVVTLPALAAGTNNIGDVDVLSVPRSQMGPAEPGTAVDSYQNVAFNLAAGADQVLVASAANKQIWVYGINFTVNVAGTVSFQDQDDTAITGIMQFGATGGMAVSPSGNFSMPLWKLGTDKDLEVDVVTSELDGCLQYAVVSV